MPGSSPPKAWGRRAELAVDPVADHRRLDADPGQDRPGDAVGLVEDGGQQVLGGDLGVVGGSGPARRPR